MRKYFTGATMFYNLPGLGTVTDMAVAEIWDLTVVLQSEGDPQEAPFAVEETYFKWCHFPIPAEIQGLEQDRRRSHFESALYECNALTLTITCRAIEVSATLTIATTLHLYRSRGDIFVSS